MSMYIDIPMYGISPRAARRISRKRPRPKARQAGDGNGISGETFFRCLDLAYMNRLLKKVSQLTTT